LIGGHSFSGAPDAATPPINRQDRPPMSSLDTLLHQAAGRLPGPTVDAILDRMRQARAVQIVGHIRPDGDCIGSILAVHAMLSHWNIPHAMAAPALPADGGYVALTDYCGISRQADPALNPDLAVYVDCADPQRGILDWTPPADIVNIDHHGTNKGYGKWNWIDANASAVGEMLFFLVERAAIPWSPDLATALLIAITTDTGSFRFNNTGALQHAIAARLIEEGARAEQVSRMAYDSQPIEAIHMTGTVLHGITPELGGRLTWSELRKDVYEACGGEAFAPENLADTVRQVRGCELAILFHEQADGHLRASFRATGRIDVSRLAAQWGGGGHTCAAGVTLETKDYIATRDMVLAAARKAVAQGV
jgi:phosphoesterase RecJ-like protein